MGALLERWASIWETIKSGPARIPSRVQIPPEQVVGGDGHGEPFDANTHYFLVRINQLFLQNQREWFKTYDPMVFAVSEFRYADEDQAVPFVVGPSLMEKYGKQVPQGMVMSDTRVAGLHPYRGGRVSVAVILSRVKREDSARNLLGIVETASRALDFSTQMVPFLKVAGAVVDGVEALLGLSDSAALIGYRKEFDPDGGDAFTPGYFAIIDGQHYDPESFWVRNHELHVKGKNDELEPFRDADFVLYSIGQTKDRSDATSLATFQQLWPRVVRNATEAKDDAWLNAKANMAVLFQELTLSPDLTMGQASRLTEQYSKNMQVLHQQTLATAKLGKVGEEPDEDAALRDRARSILEL